MWLALNSNISVLGKIFPTKNAFLILSGLQDISFVAVLLMANFLSYPQL